MKKNTRHVVSEGEDARETDHACKSSQMITYIFFYCHGVCSVYSTLCIQCAAAWPKKDPETLTFSLQANTVAMSETTNDSNHRPGWTHSHEAQ